MQSYKVFWIFSLNTWEITPETPKIHHNSYCMANKKGFPESEQQVFILRGIQSYLSISLPG